jgi:thioredoxin 1
MKYILKLLLVVVSCTNFFLEAQVIHITSMNQLKSIISSAKNVVIKFYADFCPPCKVFAPTYSQISDEAPFNNAIIFVEVNTQQCRDVAAAYGVQSIPTAIFVKNQNIVATHTGAKGAAQFKQMLKNYFSL